jgi:uncharacterized repeat protein (TIGR03843 family)
MEQLPGSLAPGRVLDILSEGEIAPQGLIPWSSNATLLVAIRHEGASTLAIYKPERGETPLWDFARGTLGKREVAAYLVCEAIGWSLVPPTVLRDGPYGLGSIQLFIHAREDAHYFTIRDAGTHAAELMCLAALDAVANNADRKSGHCLLDQQGHLWAIDNALTFHVDPKLRTVIWDFAGQPLPGQVLDGLGRLQEALRVGALLEQALSSLLSEGELVACRDRVRQLIRAGRFPEPGPVRVVPWPLV